jgi:predicted TIM-barrel fold metal-dependent hydrolase
MSTPAFFAFNAVVGSSFAQATDFPRVSDLLAHLDRLGIARAVTWHVGARDFHPRWGNDRLLAEIASTPGAPGRVVPSFLITPTMLLERGAVDWLRSALQEHAVRALRFSLYREEWSLDEIEPLLRQVLDLSPVLILDLREPLPKPALLDLAARLPELPIILTNAMWPDMVKVLDLMRRRDNLLVETSWLHSYDTLSLLVRSFGAERVVFGVGPASHAGAAIAGLLQAGLPDADRELIAHGNAERLLNVPPLASSAPSPLLARPFWARMIRREPLGVDFIDAHAHLGPVGMWPGEDPDLPAQARAMLGWMDRLGLSLTLVSGEQALFCEPVEGNRFLEDSLAPYGDRFHGYLAFNPFYRRELEARLDDFFARPFFVGFKVLCDYWRVPLTDPRFTPAWEYAHAHRLPILAHTWGGPYDAPSLLQEIAPAYPDAIFLLGHSGGSVRSEAEELAVANPNVYLEWCGSFTCPDSWVRTIQRVGADHVIFGSDAIAHDIYWELGRLLSQDLPDAQLAPLLGANMREILSRRR